MKSFIYSIFFLFAISASSQNMSADEVFYKYSTHSVSTYNLFNSISSSKRNTNTIKIAHWEMDLHRSNLLDEDYKSIDQDGNIVSTKATRAIPMNGYTSKGGRVSLTIGDGFVYGFVKEGDNLYYIEPARFYNKKGLKDDVIIYNTKDIIPSETKTCGFHDTSSKMKAIKKENSGYRMPGCLEVEYAICNDWSIVNKYGSAVNAENRAIGITNDVNTDYDNAFENEIRLNVTGQFNSTCSSCDPWSNTTSINTLLDEFTAWGINVLNNTGNSNYIKHDIASLWSNRDFDGSTIGLAWVSAVCWDSYKYNVLQDINDNGYQLRVLTTHELGHNFGSGHDAAGSGYIMAPAINNTTSWSANSISSINSTFNSVSCLASCSPLVPEVSFSGSTMSTDESGASGSAGPCNMPYKDVTTAVSISSSPSSNVNVSINVSAQSTAENLEDYELLTNSITFTPTSNLTQNVTFRVYDDVIEELDESIILSLSINSGTANSGSYIQQTVTLGDFGDDAIISCCIPGAIVEYYDEGTVYSFPGIFNGAGTDEKSRLLLKASLLQSQGLQAGFIDRLGIYVYTKGSNGVFNDFRIGMTEVTTSNLNNTPWYNTDQVFIGDVTTFSGGYNNFEFQQPFIWDGTSNIYVEFCYNNSSAIGQDIILGFDFATTSSDQADFNFYSGSTNGCSANPSTSSPSYNSSSGYDIVPAVLLRQAGIMEVETAINSASNGKIRVGETAHLYSSDDEIIASIKNVGNTDMNCITATVETAGNGKSNLPFGSFEYSDKTIRIEADNNSVYELTLYFKQSELAVWGGNILGLNLIKSSSMINSSNESNSDIIFNSSVESDLVGSNNIAYTTYVNGSAYFALSDAYSCDVKGDLIDSDFVIEDIGAGLLMKNISGDQYLLSVNSSGNIIATLNNSAASSKLMEGDIYITSSSRALQLTRSSGNYTRINVDGNGNVVANNSSSTSSKSINVTDNYFALMQNGAGIVFTSSNGNCYKLYIDEAGNVMTGAVPCGV